MRHESSFGFSKSVNAAGSVFVDIPAPSIAADGSLAAWIGATGPAVLRPHDRSEPARVLDDARLVPERLEPRRECYDSRVRFQFGRAVAAAKVRKCDRRLR